jgi:hypothetical protein
MDTLLRTAPVSSALVRWAEEELRAELNRSGRLAGRPWEIFAQGSRANDTFLEPSSDIDLILMLRSEGGDGQGWEAFRDDVLATLGESHSVRMGRRCLNVDDPGSLFAEMVDILVATEYRHYPEPGAAPYEQGVFFRDRQGHPIVNFPKQHRRNGDAKDRRTGGRFKEVVRAAKRAKKRAEREGLIATGGAPSYLLECLLHNVPDDVYRTASAEAAYRGALAWLRRRELAELAGLTCQNGINPIFGPGPDQWAPEVAARIIDVLHAI